MSMSDKSADLIAVKTADKYGASGRYAVVIYTDGTADDQLNWTFVRSENIVKKDMGMSHYATALILELERLFGKDTIKNIKGVLKAVEKERKNGTEH